MFLRENNARKHWVILLVWLSAFIASSYGNCGVPPRLDFAMVEDRFIGQNNFSAGANVTYTCLPGYIRNPGVKNIIFCSSNSEWSTPETFCQRRKCPNPGDIENGDVHYDSVLFGSRVNYTCHTGYNMISRKNFRECLADGTWSNEVPVCQVQICIPPLPITDGSFDPFQEEYVYQEAVKYQCNDKKYALLGDSIAVCTASGNWSTDGPKCVVVECPSPDVPNAVRVSGVTGPYHFNNAVRFECSPGFTMKGATSVKCNASSQWDPALPTCSKNNVAAVMGNGIVILTTILLGHLINPF